VAAFLSPSPLLVLRPARPHAESARRACRWFKGNEGTQRCIHAAARARCLPRCAERGRQSTAGAGASRLDRAERCRHAGTRVLTLPSLAWFCVCSLLLLSSSSLALALCRPVHFLLKAPTPPLLHFCRLATQ